MLGLISWVPLLEQIAVGAFYAGIPFLASIAPLLVYLADSAMTLIRRMAGWGAVVQTASNPCLSASD